MARFHDVVGYGISEEDPAAPGNWVDRIVEFSYTGDILNTQSNLEPGEQLNPDITVLNSISIVADQYAVEHFAFIKYVRWSGVRWTVTSVKVLPPRLILSIGKVYNGPTK